MADNTQIPEDCPAWLAQWIGKSDERLGNIEQTLIRLVKRTAGSNTEEDPPRSVTFKWLAEKFLVPAMFLLSGYLIAHGS